MKTEKRISKSGKLYYYSYQKTGRPHIGCPPKVKVAYNRNIQECLLRDNYICQICGNQKNLHVHHKDSKGHLLLKYEANDNLANLQTLCAKCHMRLHYGVLEKYQEIVNRRRKGETFQSIANSFGISRQRIQNIYSRN